MKSGRFLSILEPRPSGFETLGRPRHLPILRPCASRVIAEALLRQHPDRRGAKGLDPLPAHQTRCLVAPRLTNTYRLPSPALAPGGYKVLQDVQAHPERIERAIPSSGGGTFLYNGEWRMRQNAALAHLGGTAMLLAVTGWSGAATAQVNCGQFLPGRPGPIAISASAVSPAKTLRSPPALRSSRPTARSIAP